MAILVDCPTQLGFSFVFHDKAKRTQQGNLLWRSPLKSCWCCWPVVYVGVEESVGDNCQLTTRQQLGNSIFTGPLYPWQYFGSFLTPWKNFPLIIRIRPGQLLICCLGKPQGPVVHRIPWELLNVALIQIRQIVLVEQHKPNGIRIGHKNRGNSEVLAWYKSDHWPAFL